MKIYLAGPEVFLAAAREIGAAKRALCAAAGHEGLYPLDADLDLKGLSPAQAAGRIRAANLAMIEAADCLIANMTPFRGPGMDAGTAYEMGYAGALGKAVHAYTNDARVYRARVSGIDPNVSLGQDGRWRDEHDLEVEEFGLADNLMMAAGLSSPISVYEGPWLSPLKRYTELSAFKACLARV